MRSSDEIMLESYYKDIPILIKKFAATKSIEEAVKTCEDGHELLWLAKGINLPFRKKIILAKALCAKTVVHLMKEPDSINAINIGEKFGLTDKISLGDLKNAYNKANLAQRRSALAYYHYDTAPAELSAAQAARDVCYNGELTLFFTDVARQSAYAVDDYANAAAYAAYDYDTARNNRHAYIENQKQTADICREIFGKELIELINNILKS